MKTTEVTGFEISSIDGEDAGVAKCICGFTPSYWAYSISIDPNVPFECPKCGSKFYFTYSIKVYKIER